MSGVTARRLPPVWQRLYPSDGPSVDAGPRITEFLRQMEEQREGGAPSLHRGARRSCKQQPCSNYVDVSTLTCQELLELCRWPAAARLWLGVGGWGAKS